MCEGVMKFDPDANDTSVDVSDMNSGMYLIKVIDANNNEAIEKLVSSSSLLSNCS